MLASQIPAKFNIPFANNAGGSFINTIPQASQISITPGAASLFDGFPPLNFTPVASGGVPPFGQDFNGILNQSTAWDRWFSAGGPILYDATFQAAVGGYPNGAIVGSLVVPGNYWLSTVDNNTSNPDTGGSNWITPPAMKGTGDWAWRPVSTALANHVILNGTTIGSASSAAAQLASSTALFVYQYFWNNFSNTQCPVTGGRGANATADFNANKPIATLNMQATGIIGVDGMGGTPTGLLNNVPVQSGSATIPGSVLGQNLNTLITANLPPYTPAGTIVTTGTVPFASATFNFPGGGGTSFVQATSNTAISATSTFTGTAQGGTSTAVGNVERSMLGYWFIHI